MSKSSRNSSSENIITFVSEGMTYALDFRAESHRKLAAISISKCHILEIANRDTEGKRTVMSLSHFMVSHLIHQKNLNQSIDTVIGNFTAQGGDIATAEFRIYGGVKGENSKLRVALKDSIHRVAPGVKIDEPKGHEVEKDPLSRDGESTDYLFSRDGVTFRKMTLSSLSSGDESRDEVSKNLKDEKGKFDRCSVAVYQNFLSCEFNKVRSALEAQTKKVESDLARGNETLKSVYERIEEAQDNPEKMAVIVGIIESQVGPMSLKVCGRNGLVEEGLRISQVEAASPQVVVRDKGNSR